MWSRASLIGRTLLVAIAGFALLLVGLNQANAIDEGGSATSREEQTDADNGETDIQAPELISIPYGFDATLPLTDEGASVVASGVGACTDGHEITIAFTITLSTTTGAQATGTWNGDCTGELQTWTGEGAFATPSPNVTVGRAEACAFAETRDADEVTATQSWCDPVIVGETVYLPVVLTP